MYGLDQIVAIAPPLLPVTAYNARHYYAEVVRSTLIDLGWSEIFTSSFRNQDEVRIKNALASDKGYLRSSLHENLVEAIQKNIPHRDLLGLSAVKIFEIGTVFSTETESVHVGLGVQTGTVYKSKLDDVLLTQAQDALAVALGTPLVWLQTKEGVSDFSLDDTVVLLTPPTTYKEVLPRLVTSFTPFSLFPASSRDVAFWAPTTTTHTEVESLVRSAAGSLCVRVTPFDTFIKDDRTSFAFRLVFQSKEKTLDGSDVDEQMALVHEAVTGAGFEVR